MMGFSMIEEYLDRVFVNKRKDEGFFITFAGFDASGKTTQINAIEKILCTRGHDVLVTAEPTDWYRKQKVVRDFLDNGGDVSLAKELAYLISEDRKKHINDVIKPALDAGKIVICDRYVQVTFALMMARGVEPSLIIDTNKGALCPDISFYLEVDASTLLKRLRSRDGEHLKYEERTEKRINTIVQYYKKMGKYLISIDGTQPIHKVTETLMEHIDKCERK